MKNRTILMGCMAALIWSPTAATADDSPLAKQMETLDDAYKAFRRETDPAKGAESAREAQLAVLKFLQETPSSVSGISDPAAKAKAAAKYRKMVGQLYITLCDVESAFLENDLPKVEELVKAVRESKKEGHGAFIEDE